ncbi:hypothetical protein C3H85_02260 [Campylobacter jejuni]|uniref:hypothetical protein n=1 Tax=Campylobacter jejuni TaxID=197 RepID=UPI000F809581|nr:hypothetical protein [Campylobacter jejuni]RTJ16153.1 hypothetical protein C3H85_02260 [Campylobacter jejuni]
MTYREFNLIKERLSKWREERHSTYENQQEAFLGNVFEKVSEYFRAKNDLEKIDALCDIVIFCFNSFDLNYSFYIEYLTEIKNPRIYNIIDAVSFYSFKKYKNLAYNDTSIPLVISLCNNLVYCLGFDFYKCMLEKIKEIESRTGYYDESLKKFIKDTSDEAKAKWYKADYESCKL